MRYVFLPRGTLAYGQDFINEVSRARLGLKSLSPLEPIGYQLPADCEVLITHDGDDDRIGRCVMSLPASIQIFTHVHVKWSYLASPGQQNLAKILRRSRAAVVPAAFLREELLKIFPNLDCRVIPNGVDCLRFGGSTPQQRAQFRKSLRLPANARLLLGVGRLEPAKGFQILTELAKLLSHEPDLHLVVQYPGYVEPATVNAYRARAEELRQVNPGRVHAIEDLQHSNDRPVRYVDAALHPSLSEVAPLAVLEALAAGVPTIATASTPFLDELQAFCKDPECLQIVGLPEYANNNSERARLALEAADARSIARAMVACSGTACDLAEERRIALRRRIASRFSIEAMLSAFDALYREAG